MPSIPSISINTNTDSTFESSGGMTSRIRKKALESQISNDEQKLEKLSAKQTAEKSKLKIELTKYKTELSKLEKNSDDKGNDEKAADMKRRFDSFECQTCKNRRYQDQSDDSGVSFQTASHIDPSAAYSAVRSHENEHVARNKTQAEQHGQKIAYQTVTINRAICPECGRSYVSGGVTHTVTKADNSARYTVGDIKLEKDPVGSIVNVVA
ncbi:MAG: hypothetical protein MRZ39_08555 [Oscillospiraceae bacterium]|nr:hypothetical protein [Oscillospiraceae bacterium]